MTNNCFFYLNLASSRVIIAHGAVGEPLSRMALWNKSLDKGDKRCKETETAPALSPNKVTRAGSPPKRWIFDCTHLELDNFKHE